MITIDSQGHGGIIINQKRPQPEGNSDCQFIIGQKHKSKPSSLGVAKYCIQILRQGHTVGICRARKKKILGRERNFFFITKSTWTLWLTDSSFILDEPSSFSTFISAVARRGWRFSYTMLLNLNEANRAKSGIAGIPGF